MSEAIDSSIVSWSSGLRHPVLLKSSQFASFKADIGVKFDCLVEKMKADRTWERFCLFGLVTIRVTWTVRYGEQALCEVTFNGSAKGNCYDSTAATMIGQTHSRCKGD